MKIDLSKIDQTSFKIKPGTINGRQVFLINPVEFDCNWSPDNLHLRSIIVDEVGEVLSKSFSKFMNAGEKPDLYPCPAIFNDWVLTAKEDGSTFICDWINGNLNVRTRGTLTYKDHDNVADFEEIIKRYDVAHAAYHFDQYTLLFEIYSPSKVIVLKPYDKPEIVFLGAVDKNDGKLYPFFSELGKLIVSVYEFKVPEIFDMSGTLSELISNIKKWEGKEGVVLYYNGGQNQIKIKTDFYLLRHRMKSLLNSYDAVLDLWFEQGKPDVCDLYDYIRDTIDFEVAESCQFHLDKIMKDNVKAIETMFGLIKYAGELKQSGAPRKDLAAKILGEKKEYSSYLFKFLDGKTLDDRDFRKLMG